MSSRTEKQQEASATPTPTEPSPKPAASAASTEVSDAEVVQDVKPRTWGAPPRTVKLDASKVFDVDVSDAANAKKGPRPEPSTVDAGDAPPPRRKKKNATPEAPPEVTDFHLEKARGYIRTAEELQRAGLKHRYRDLLEPHNLAELDERLKLSDAQIDVMARPLAEGLALHGVSLPWYAELGISGLSFLLVRTQAVAAIEEEFQRREKAKRAAGKS